MSHHDPSPARGPTVLRAVRAIGRFVRKARQAIVIVILAALLFVLEGFTRCTPLPLEPPVLYGPPPADDCWTDVDCAQGEVCEGAIVCPPGQYCILPDEPGTCVEATNECMSDADCREGEVCEGASVCPPDVYCILPDQPGTCVEPTNECMSDADCREGEVCEGASVCPPGVYCILPDQPGTCVEAPRDCMTDADCREGEVCVGANTCPPGWFCILPAQPGTCEPAPAPAGSLAQQGTWRTLVESELS